MKSRALGLVLLAALFLLLAGTVAASAGLSGKLFIASGLALAAGAAAASRGPGGWPGLTRSLLLGLYTLLVLAILAVSDGLLENHRARYDWTGARAFTLTPATLRVLRELDEDVAVTAVFSATSPGRHMARDLLKLYELASGRIRIRTLDPDLHPSEARRHGDAAGGGLVVERGNRRRVVRRPAERELTMAIHGLGMAARARVAFACFPGEGTATDRGVLGYALAAAALEKENFQVVSMDPTDPSTSTTPVTLIVPYGRRDLPSRAPDAIEALRTRGTSVLVAVEPGEPRPVLAGLVASWGLLWQRAKASDPSSHLENDPGTLVVRCRSDHPATQGLAEALLPGATPFALPSEDDIATWQPLAALSPRASSTLPDGGAGPAGALVVLAAAERRTGPEPGRRAVIGDTDFFTNGALSRWPVNRELLVNLVNWLSEREELLGPWPQPEGPPQVILTDRQLRAIAAIVLVGMPGLFCLIALGVWLEGRRR